MMSEAQRRLAAVCVCVLHALSAPLPAQACDTDAKTHSYFELNKNKRRMNSPGPAAPGPAAPGPAGLGRSCCSWSSLSCCSWSCWSCWYCWSWSSLSCWSWFRSCRSRQVLLVLILLALHGLGPGSGVTWSRFCSSLSVHSSASLKWL